MTVYRYEADHIGYEDIRAIVALADSDPMMGTEDLIRCGSAVKPLGDWRFWLATYPHPYRNPRSGYD